MFLIQAVTDVRHQRHVCEQLSPEDLLPFGVRTSDIVAACLRDVHVAFRDARQFQNEKACTNGRRSLLASSEVSASRVIKEGMPFDAAKAFGHNEP